MVEYYPTSQPLIACRSCHTHIALQDELVSKSFHGQHGEAYLYRSIINVDIGAKQDKTLVTGLHTIANLTCRGCGTIIGWTYFKAYVESQAYKEGKYILEKELIVKENNWSPF